MANALYYGDNLRVLRDSIASESVDLIYLDPPFNSQASYNVLFKSPAGKSAEAQIEAFEDTWHWGDDSERSYDEVLSSANTNAAEMLRAMRGFLGENDMMAYLAMMAVRLLELHRVLKPTGSLYLHCDPTASHYLKLLLDAIFGVRNYRNEVIWERTTGRKSGHQYGRVHDTLLFYTRSGIATWNAQAAPQSEDSVKGHDLIRDSDGVVWRHSDLSGGGAGPPRRFGDRDFSPPTGRHWQFDQAGIDALWAKGRIVFSRGGQPRLRTRLEDLPGIDVRDVWTDIRPINAAAAERLGYPTQKPLALLERIIKASSNEGDVVLDPFCGCGTAVHAAQKLGRNWIGIDITCLAIGLIERRLKDAFPGIAFDVYGTPKTLQDAVDLAERDKYQFQWWAASAVGARPYAGKKKGADGGIDGILFFKSGAKTTESAIISVKGGNNVGVGAVRDLHSVIEREKAAIGVLITAVLPTRAKQKEAAAVGLYDCGLEEKFPRLQIITLAELFQGKLPRIPLVDTAATFRTAAREDLSGKKQGRLDL